MGLGNVGQRACTVGQLGLEGGFVDHGIGIDGFNGRSKGDHLTQLGVASSDLVQQIPLEVHHPVDPPSFWIHRAWPSSRHVDAWVIQWSEQLSQCAWGWEDVPADKDHPLSLGVDVRQESIDGLCFPFSRRLDDQSNA
jgi:hypothetical protein